MKFCLDRFEGRVAVCLCEEPALLKQQYIFSLEEHPDLTTLVEGDIFEATLDRDGNMTDFRPLKDETAQRLAAAQARLHALAARSKKKRES
jgi:hypothetical protein